MRLSGRLAAAVEVLADMETRHRPVADALRDWGLSHRFAGAGDRAAIGNLVYDALRRRSSVAWRMGDESPWALAVGTAVFAWNTDPDDLNRQFAADQHAPAAIPEATLSRIRGVDLEAAPEHVRADLPEWLVPHFRATFGEEWIAEAAALAERPPLDLRVNTLKLGRDKSAAQLKHVDALPTHLSPVALRIASVDAGRRHPNIQVEESFQRGRIEVQDEGSQICALMAGARPGEQVLDFCAGGGGKTLAIAAQMQNRGQVFAHDSDRNRLAPIFDRLKRAGVRNAQVLARNAPGLPGLVGRMDRVLVDAPCTGVGVWRRRPDSKWRVTADSLQRRMAEQDSVLAEAAAFVRPGGVLIYATCSLLRPENQERIAAFLAAHADFAVEAIEPAWRDALGEAPMPAATAEPGLILSPHRTGTDGFFIALLRRA